jgi:hypothetical protein
LPKLKGKNNKTIEAVKLPAKSNLFRGRPRFDAINKGKGYDLYKEKKIRLTACSQSSCSGGTE